MPSINLNHEYPEINRADANALAIGALNGVLKSDGANGFSVVPVDAAPTANSTNLVESGGVKAAIDAAVQNATPKITASNDPSTSAFSVLCDTAIAGEAKPKLYGKSVVINQLLQNGDFSDGTTGWSVFNASQSVSDKVNTITVNTDTDKPRIYRNMTVITGHVYLARAYMKPSYSGKVWCCNTSMTATQNAWSEYGVIVTASSNTFQVGFGADSEDAAVSDTVQIKNCILIDLTAIGFTSAETASVSALKTAWLKKFGYPLPQYIPYNAGSIVSNNATYLMHGRNIWDEEIEHGLYDATTGLPVADASAWRSVNFIPIAPSTAYYVGVAKDVGSASFRVFFYDENKAFISSTTGKNFVVTSPDNAAYMMFHIGASYGAAYTHDICINLSATAFNGTYEPSYNGGSVTADNLNGIGTAQDVADYGAGVLTRATRQVLLNDPDKWVADTGTTQFRYVDEMTDRKIFATSFDGLMCSAFPVDASASLTMRWRGASDLRVGIYDANGTLTLADVKAMASAGRISIVYATATPTTSSLSAPALTTQSGYNSLDPVSGDVQSAECECEYAVDVIAYIDKKLAEL